MVWHGVADVSPHVGALEPPLATKIPRVTSPSMPSQFASTNEASGSSVGDGGAHVPQPVAPWHVRVPAHAVLNGVMIVHDSCIPVLSASQSHAFDTGMYCRMTSPPADMSWQVKPVGHSMVRQSRPQNSL